MLNRNVSAAASLAMLSTTLSLPAATAPEKPLEEKAPRVRSVDSAPAPLVSSLTFTNAPLSYVLDQIAERSNLILFSSVDLNSKVSLTLKGEVASDNLIQALSAALAPKKIHLDLAGRLLKVLPESSARYIGSVKFLSQGKELSPRATIGTFILPLSTIEPVGLIKTLESYLPQDTLAIASADANALILHGRERELARIVTMARLLDGVPTSASQISVVPMRNATATSISKTIGEVFSSDRSSTNFVATFDPHSNSLIMRGPAEVLYAAQLLAGRLDTKQFEASEIRMVRLRHADAQEMATLIAGLFPKGSTEEVQSDQGNGELARSRETVLAVPEARSNTLLIRAPSSVVPALEGLVAALDKDSIRTQSLHFYQVKNADPIATAQVLQQLFQANSQASLSGASQPTSALLQRAQRQTTVTGFGASTSQSGQQRQQQ